MPCATGPGPDRYGMPDACGLRWPQRAFPVVVVVLAGAFLGVRDSLFERPAWTKYNTCSVLFWSIDVVRHSHPSSFFHTYIHPSNPNFHTRTSAHPAVVSPLVVYLLNLFVCLHSAERVLSLHAGSVYIITKPNARPFTTRPHRSSRLGLDNSSMNPGTVQLQMFICPITYLLLL